MSKLITKNNSRTNITNTSFVSQSKIINYQEIISLKKLLKPEIRELKGKDYTDAYVRLLEKQYERLIEDSLHNNEILKQLKNNQLFQKVLDKTKNKIIMRNQTQNDLLSTNKSITVSKFTNTTNNSPIKKTDKKKIKKTTSQKTINSSNTNTNYKSTYWEDYDFVKTNENKNKNTLHNKNSYAINDNVMMEISEKGTLEEQTSEKININKNNKNNNNNKPKNNKNNNKYLENYYLYLLNRRQKRNSIEETNEEKQKDKNNIEIMRKILDHIYNDDELIQKNLEDDSIPEFYKRFIIQDEIKKDNLFEKRFKLNYRESQKMKGPKLSYGSRIICKNILNYQPIDKRLDRIIKKRENNINRIKRDVENKKCSNTSRSRRKSWKETEEWIENMDNWNRKKLLKIQQKKEEIEKKNLSCSECKFKPTINKNAHLKKEDEGLLFSDRLYSEYFTLREKRQNMIEKQQNNFSFRPNINK